MTTQEKITRLSLMADKYREAIEKEWSYDQLPLSLNLGLCLCSKILFGEHTWLEEFNTGARPIAHLKYWWEFPEYLWIDGKPFLPALQIRYEFLLSTIEKLKENDRSII